MAKRGKKDLLPHLVASIGADYADSFAACRELMATMFDLDAPSPEVRASYDMDFAVYDYGPIKLGMSRSSASIMVRDPELIARSGVDHFHAQYYRSHGFALTLDGAERQVNPGDVCLLDLSRPVSIRTDGIDNLSVIIDRGLLEPLLADADDLHGLVLSGDSEAGVAVQEHLEEMWLQGPHLTVAEGQWSHATAALLAGVVSANGQNRAASRAELRKAQFRAACRHIDRRIGDPDLGPIALTAHLFITRPTLYRMFEPHGGIGKYILGRRLTGVFRDLSDPLLSHEKVATQLSRWGFESHTAAGRAFRAAYGMTPSQCRSQALALHKVRRPGGGAVFDVPDEMPAKVEAFKGAPRPGG